MSTKYHLLINGIEQGPVSGKDIQTLPELGILKPDDYVKQKGSDKWFKEKKIRDLKFRIENETLRDLEPLPLEDPIDSNNNESSMVCPRKSPQYVKVVSGSKR